LLPFVHWGASIFHFIRPDASFVMIIASLSVGYFIATETVKRLYYSHPNGWHILYKKNKQRTLAGM
jgi:hypothetical protein